MIVRFVEMHSGKALWIEERSSLYSELSAVSYNRVVQKNSKRRAERWIAKIDDDLTTQQRLVTAFVEPFNKRARRRASRRGWSKR